MNPLITSSWLEPILVGFLFGFGFAIAQSAWGAILGMINRPAKAP